MENIAAPMPQIITSKTSKHSSTYKSLDTKNNNRWNDCYQFFIKRLLKVPQTSINSGFHYRTPAMHYARSIPLRSISPYQSKNRNRIRFGNTVANACFRLNKKVSFIANILYSIPVIKIKDSFPFLPNSKISDLHPPPSMIKLS